MLAAFAQRRCVGPAMTLVVGIVLGGLLPHSPLHAVATDHSDAFAIATGPLDDETEAIYFLDFATGNLKASALSPITRRFNAVFYANVQQDLGVEPAQNPKYLMVTGRARFRPNGGTVQPSQSIVYVAELTSGRAVAYAAPWAEHQANSGIAIKFPLAVLDVVQFRGTGVR